MESFAQSRLLIYIVLFLVGILGAIGDIAVNQWAKNFKWQWWIVASIIWIGAATLFGLLLHWNYFGFGVAVVLALLIHSICVLVWDHLWEKVTLTPLQWIGVALAIAALCCIELGRRNTSPTDVTMQVPTS